MDQNICHYRIIEKVGEGGMGCVYKAEDSRLKRFVALKLLGPRCCGEPESDERLLAEARVAAALSHPNVATVFDVGASDGRVYVAMEYIEGETVGNKIGRGRFPLSEALEVSIRVLGALGVAHERGIAHCDIKPSNIMVTPEGTIKVVDFGLASLASPSPDLLEDGAAADTESAGSPSSRPALSSRDNGPIAGPIAGSVSYMSPEQVRGEPLDGRSDIFSTGVVLFEMLTGRRPYDGESPGEIAKAVIGKDPSPIGAYRDDVPLELEAILRKALEKDRGSRYQKADEMMQALNRVRTGPELRSVAASPQVAEGSTDGFDGRSPGAVNRGSGLFSRLRSASAAHREWFLVAALAGLLGVGLNAVFNWSRSDWATEALLFLFAALSVLAYLVLGRRSRSTEAKAPIAIAFRGLLPFQEGDRHRFFGRESDVLALLDQVSHNDLSFVVLFGDSGCGKTSLLRAGVVPKLWEDGYVPLYCRSYKEPLASLLAECQKQTRIAPEPGETLLVYLKRVEKGVDARIVLIFDQFEEFFVNFKTGAERAAFLRFVADSAGENARGPKFLISIRSDFLHMISTEFEGVVADPLAGSRLYHLHNFDQEQAARIIEMSVRQAGLSFEPGLSKAVARDLTVGDVVLPSELQIVGERLQVRHINTIQEFSRIGGKESLVNSYLEDVVQSSADPETARMVLRGLISDENTRLTLSLDEITRRTQRNRSTVQRIITLFVGSRLINEIQEDEPWRYELMHEYLIEKINQITGTVMDATQRANRLFRQYLSNYSLDSRTVIPLGKLWFIRRYSDTPRGERERELMNKSLRWGTVKAGASVMLLFVGATIVAAALSVVQEWDGIVLNDGHTAAARKAVFSPDGRLLVTSGEDGSVIVWDFVRQQRVARFSTKPDWVRSVAFSPDGKWFAAPGDDGTVTVWDAALLQRAVVLRGHSSAVNAVAFSPDGRWFASTTDPSGGRTIVWDTTDWVKKYELPYGVIWGDLIFSPDGRHLMIGAQVWDLQASRMSRELDPGTTYNSFAPDGRTMVGVDHTGTVFFFDVARLWDKAEARLLGSHRVHSYHGRATAFSPDGKLAASGAEDIVLWDAATQTKLVRLKHSAQVWSLAFSPDRRWLVSTHDDGSTLLWDVAERELAASFDGHCASVHAVAFSPDGKRVASAGEDQSVIVWNIDRNEKEMVLIGHSRRVTSAAFSPDGKHLATSDMDANTTVWDLESCRKQWSHEYVPLSGEKAASYCIAFSPDGRFLASTELVYDSRDGGVVFDQEAAKASFPGEIGQVYGIAFSPVARLMACATDNGALVVWNTEKSQLDEKIRPSSTPLISIDFSPDGKQLVTGDDDGVVQLWEVSPLRQIAILGRHAARIKSVRFSPDGSEVASAGDDQKVLLWNVDRQNLIADIGTHTSPVLAVAFSPDGRRLVCGGHDKTVRVYTRHRRLWGRILG